MKMPNMEIPSSISVTWFQESTHFKCQALTDTKQSEGTSKLLPQLQNGEHTQPVSCS